MRRGVLLALALSLFAPMDVDASAVTEAWCLNNPNNCVCAENFQSTSYTDSNGQGDSVARWCVGNNITGPAPTNAKPCLYGGHVNSMMTNYDSIGCAAGDQTQAITVGTDSNLLNLIPNRDPTFVQRYLRASGNNYGGGVGSGQSAAYRSGYDPIPLTGVKRIAIRWYQYYSTNWEAEYITCNNSKIAHNSATNYNAPYVTFEWLYNGSSYVYTHIYSFINADWTWAGHSSFDGFTSFPRDYAGVRSAPWTALFPFLTSRGHWIRHEIVVRHPKFTDASAGGYDYEFWVTDITAGTAPKLEGLFSGSCSGCIFPGPDFPANSGAYPKTDMPSLHLEVSREGTCAGWQAWLYLTVAKWRVDSAADCVGAGNPEACCIGPGAGPSCNNLMIGAAAEMEGGGAPDTDPPSRFGGLPTGFLSSGTTSTTISLNTNEAATCKYSTTPPASYAAMANTFSTTGGTSHSQAVGGLVDGGSYSYYVRCTDSIPNANIDDYIIVFQVSTPTASPSTLLRGAKLTGGKIP